MRAAGVTATAADVETVFEPTTYHAIVLGSAVYAGSWMKSAVKFLHQNEGALVSRPVWFFSSGPTGAGDPVTLLGGWRFPHDQQSVADRIQPRDITVFHGKMDLDTLGFGERMVIKAMRGKTGDFRDWDAIDRWATTIAASLLKSGVAELKVQT